MILARIFARLYEEVVHLFLVLAMQHVFSLQTSRGTAPQDLANRPSQPRRPETKPEEDVIRTRLATARDDFSTSILIGSLERVDQVIRQSKVDSLPTSYEAEILCRIAPTPVRTLLAIPTLAPAVRDACKITISRSRRKMTFMPMWTAEESNRLISP